MGWLVWLFLTGSCAAAAYLVAVAAFPERGVLERAMATLIVMPALLIIDIQLCGLTDHFSPWPLGLVGMALFVGVGGYAYRRAANVRVAFMSDLRAPVRLAQDVWREREVAVLIVLVAAAAMFVVLRMVWYFKSWTWDPTWYHVPITSYAVQNHSTGWSDTPNIYTQGYPRTVELLAAWNCVFPRDNRFDDSSQLPFAFLGMAVVAAWARRLGASRGLAAGLGAGWFLLPPVFLQAHSTHVDVACGSLFSAGVYYLSEENSARSRWFCLLALGLYLGCKFTGAFHLAVLAPWLAVRAVLELKRSEVRWRVALSISASIVLLLGLGIYHYVENFLHTGNPTWPFMLKVPFRAEPLAAPVDVNAMWGAPGGSPYFWGAPGAFMEMLRSWFDTKPFYAPDVRSGGFGPLFRWLLLPCALAVAADALRLRNLRNGLPVLALFVLALAVPGAWWTRFVISAGGAALLAFAIVHGQMPNRVAKAALSCALLVGSCVGYGSAYAGFIQYPKQFAEAQAKDWVGRSAMQMDTFLWPTSAGELRERELKAGDVVAYDESVVFLSELFSHDYRTKVTFVSSGDPDSYVERLRALKARWAAVNRESEAARRLKGAGAEWLFAAPFDYDMYRMPAQ